MIKSLVEVEMTDGYETGVLLEIDPEWVHLECIQHLINNTTGVRKYSLVEPVTGIANCMIERSDVVAIRKLTDILYSD